jgi:hypothetical protein
MMHKWNEYRKQLLTTMARRQSSNLKLRGIVNLRILASNGGPTVIQ